MLPRELCVCVSVHVWGRISSNGEYYGVKCCYELRLRIRGSQQGAGLWMLTSLSHTDLLITTHTYTELHTHFTWVSINRTLHRTQHLIRYFHLLTFEITYVTGTFSVNKVTWVMLLCRC